MSRALLADHRGILLDEILTKNLRAKKVQNSERFRTANFDREYSYHLRNGSGYRQTERALSTTIPHVRRKNGALRSTNKV